MIRKYDPQKDADQVIAIWLEASAESHSFIDYEYWVKNKEAMRLVYLPSANTLVYSLPEGEIAGFIAMVGNTVAALFIAPAHQGKRIGTLLLNRAKDNHDNLDLFVYALNTRALRFYLRNGFIKNGYHTDPNTGELQFQMVYSRDIYPQTLSNNR